MNRALIFDCDGVLGDTERHGHLPAFNQMWEELGVPWQWSLEEYACKLKIGGGKERMRSLFSDPRFLRAFTPPVAEREREELITRWHQRKSIIYRDIVNSGAIPPRSGVKRLAEESLSAGWILAVASTSAQKSVEAMLCHAVGQTTANRFSLILAGDVVNAKKPAPDIYLLAAARMAVGPGDCVVIEDSSIGASAAFSAGIKCVVTINDSTRGEVFSEASLVLNCLGDPGGEECVVLANRSHARPGKYFTVDDLEEVRTGAIGEAPFHYSTRSAGSPSE